MHTLRFNTPVVRRVTPSIDPIEGVLIRHEDFRQLSTLRR